MIGYVFEKPSYLILEYRVCAGKEKYIEWCQKYSTDKNDRKTHHHLFQESRYRFLSEIYLVRFRADHNLIYYKIINLYATPKPDATYSFTWGKRLSLTS